MVIVQGGLQLPQEGEQAAVLEWSILEMLIGIHTCINTVELWLVLFYGKFTTQLSYTVVMAFLLALTVGMTTEGSCISDLNEQSSKCHALAQQALICAQFCVFPCKKLGTIMKGKL